MPNPRWLLSAITNAQTGEQSAKSVALLLAVVILGAALGALVLLACFRVALDPATAQAITGISTALGGVAGGGYVAGKVSGAWAANRSPFAPSSKPVPPISKTTEAEIEARQGE